MGRHNSHWDERRWAYQNVAFRRGGGRKPRHRRSGGRRYSERLYAAIIGVLAVVGGVTLGALFVAFVGGLVGR